MQQTFLQAHRALGRGVEPVAEATWLLTIARNVCLTRVDAVRRRARVEFAEDPSVLAEIVGAEDTAPELSVELRGGACAPARAAAARVVPARVAGAFVRGDRGRARDDGVGGRDAALPRAQGAGRPARRPEAAAAWVRSRGAARLGQIGVRRCRSEACDRRRRGRCGCGGGRCDERQRTASGGARSGCGKPLRRRSCTRVRAPARTRGAARTSRRASTVRHARPRRAPIGVVGRRDGCRAVWRRRLVAAAAPAPSVPAAIIPATPLDPVVAPVAAPVTRDRGRRPCSRPPRPFPRPAATVDQAAQDVAGTTQAATETVSTAVKRLLPGH